MGRNRERPGGVDAVVGEQAEHERRLVDRACGGDARAYEDLLRMHQQTAFRTACVLAGSASDAEDALQEAFVKAWGALGRFRPGAPFRPWLLAIVANEARSRRRAAGRRRGWEERAAGEAVATGAVTAAGADVAVLASERRAQLLDALGRLSDGHRTALELRYLLDLSEREMAAVLRCRQGTVKSRLARAAERLRAELGEDGA